MPPSYHTHGFFSEILLTHFHPDDFELSEEVQSLPEFTEGTAEEPGSGYIIGPDPQEDLNIENLSTEEKEILSNIEKYTDSFKHEIFDFEYNVESWTESEADVDGERRSVYIPEMDSAEGNWSDNGVLLIRGNATAITELKKSLENKMERYISIDSLEFDNDFFLWIFSKHYKSEDIDHEIDIVDIDSMQVGTGTGSGIYRSRMRSEGDSHPEVFNSILSGGSIRRIRLIVTVGNGISVLFEASAPSGIEISVDSDYREYSKYTSLKSTIAFKFTELYKRWRSMDDKDKYPSPKFFLENIDKADSIDSNVGEVVEEYSLKRNQVQSLPEGEPTESEQLRNPRREEIFEDLTIGQALESVESEILESKESVPDNVDNIAKEVAALANTRGGVLVLGMGDDGELTGLDNIRQSDERVAGVISQSINPPVNVNMKQRSVAEADLLIVTVDQATETPRSVNGKYYKRVGTTVQELSPEELTTMIRESGEHE